MTYRKLYYRLMGRIEDIIGSMEILADPPEKVVKCVREWLIEAVRDAEDFYLEETEDLTPYDEAEDDVEKFLGVFGVCTKDLTEPPGESEEQKDK